MYVIKLKNRKVTTKAFKDGFNSYEAARQALRKMIRSLGHDSNKGYTFLGYTIQKV
jgi:hypothetical protein